MYGFITIVITCLLVTALYNRYRPEPSPTKFRKIIVETSIMFADATFWLTLPAIIAGFLYGAIKAESNYELVMTDLVTWLFLSAGLLSFSILLSYQKHHFDAHFYFLRFIAFHIFLSGGIALFFLFDAKLHHQLRFEFVDTPCFTNGSWPLPSDHIMYFIDSVLGFGMVVHILPSVRLIFRRFFKRFLHEEYGFINTLLPLISISVLLVLILLLINLWYCFYMILKIKAHARVAFGSSFQEDAFGYGQVIACGFAAQALLTFVYRLAGTCLTFQ